MANELQEKFGLTAKELEAIQHRLEAGDAIESALSAEENDGDGYHREDISVVAGELALGRLSSAESHSEAITRAVLADCIEGSTYVAVYVHASKRNHTSAYTALRGAAMKLMPYVGRTMSIPCD